MSEIKRIAKRASIVGGGTLISRVLGYARDAVIASYFGAGLASDAFFVAFRIANLLRRLVGEGALTSSFVPVFTEMLIRRTKEEANKFLYGFFTLFFFIVVALTALGILASEKLVLLMSPGFSAIPEKFALAVNLTAMMFPYMIFIGLMAIAMGALNSLKHFTVPAVAPAFFNAAIIFCVFFVTPFFKEPVYAVAVGVLLGGFLQFIVHLPVLAKYGMFPRPSFYFTDAATLKIFRLMGFSAIGLGVYQVNIFVTTAFASTLSEGSVSYLYYASRLMELPLGMFGVAFMQAVLPSLSEYAVKNDYESFKTSLSFAIRMANFVSIPATVGLAALAMPIIAALFQRGEFSGTDASETAFALYFYAVGIVPVATSRILIAAFYSIKDTHTPVWIAAVVVIFNLLLCYLLIKPLGHGGLALATSAAAFVNLALLAVALRLKLGRLGIRDIILSTVKSLAASFVMGAVIYSATIYGLTEGFGSKLTAAVIFILIVVGAAIYIAVCMALNAKEFAFFKEILQEKFFKKRQNARSIE